VRLPLVAGRQGGQYFVIDRVDMESFHVLELDHVYNYDVELLDIR
jgi:hypothetical protein